MKLLQRALLLQILKRTNMYETVRTYLYAFIYNFGSPGFAFPGLITTEFTQAAELRLETAANESPP